MGLKILNFNEVRKYASLTFSMYYMYLLNCESENIIAVGASDEQDNPCGLILAFTAYNKNDEINSSWVLCSVFVKEENRRQGIGHRLWENLKAELEKRGASDIKMQGVFGEITADVLMIYFKNMGFSEAIRIAKIFHFSKEGISERPFVKGLLANSFKPDNRFRFIPFDDLSGEQLEELKANEGGWYPGFVSPLIGKNKFNKKCTIFAVDSVKNKLAGWITAIDVNDDTRILYRTFFTREDYRDTPVGFFIFTEAIKNHLIYFPEKGGLASIPIGNERAMRFTDLFFRDAYERISYEIAATYLF